MVKEGVIAKMLCTQTTRITSFSVIDYKLISRFRTIKGIVLKRFDHHRKRPLMEEKFLLQQSIIKTLLYYDIFNYPLKVEEIHRFLPTKSVNKKTVEEVLENLCHHGQIFQFDEFFTVQNNEANILRRIKGNDFAKKSTSIAIKRASLLAKFPFVRAVFASGSFSKGYMDENSDLDFFIVTSPERLWFARTLIVMFKRVFFFNSHKYFCCNYFVDSNNLEIEEKNLFTATELATLVPLYGRQIYINVMHRNAWLLNFFPNYEINSGEHLIKEETSIIKQASEKVLKNKFWGNFEKFFMQLTIKRWRRLYEKEYQTDDFFIAFKSNEHVSKNHPNHYQQKVINSYNEKLRNYSRRFHVQLLQEEIR